MMSLTVQSIVLQTHLHLTRDAGAPRLALTLPADRDARRSGPMDCATCAALASAGHYLSPTPIALVLPVMALFGFGVPRRGRPSQHRRSPAWRNRGPPFDLLI